MECNLPRRKSVSFFLVEKRQGHRSGGTDALARQYPLLMSAAGQSLISCSSLAQKRQLVSRGLVLIACASIRAYQIIPLASEARVAITAHADLDGILHRATVVVWLQHLEMSDSVGSADTGLNSLYVFCRDARAPHLGTNLRSQAGNRLSRPSCLLVLARLR
eukprot:SAG31_NODE_12908_length_907_cov_1.127475_1_plen_162_part_00